MDLWTTRKQAEAALGSNLKQEAEIIKDSFALIDECIAAFRNVGNPYARVCGLTLLKARNLSLGSFSLMLDGLGQEAGALIRPLLETLELLEYFQIEPTRTDLAINAGLPKAGEIAKNIKGEFRDLRSYLNDHASHFGFSFESLRHLLNLSENEWMLVQPYSEIVLKTNLHTLFGLLNRIVFASAKCIETANALDIELANRIIQHQENGFSVFSSQK